MITTFVSTKKELKTAQENKAKEIIVTGELANKIHKSKKITKLGAASIGLIVTAIAAAPFTSGLSFGAAAPVAVLTGIEITAIIAASAVGIGLILAIYKEYDEISYENGKLHLKRKG
jgi:Mn2+/Fe2+ NRAMP family transporter